MVSTVTTFLIMPPNDLNENVVSKAVYLEDRLAAEFQGYSFQVVDLRKVRPVEPNGEVIFGDGMSFAVIPLVGATSDGPSGGFYIREQPPKDLVREIAAFCETFDFEKARRQAA